MNHHESIYSIQCFTHNVRILKNAVLFPLHQSPTDYGIFNTFNIVMQTLSKILRILEVGLQPSQLHQTSLSQEVATDKVHWGRLSVHQQEAIKQTFKVAFSKLWAGSILETGSRDWGNLNLGEILIHVRCNFMCTADSTLVTFQYNCNTTLQIMSQGCEAI